MEFENTFAVEAPIEEVWATLLDVERVAPCMPGAEVLDRIGDDRFKVAVKVKLGPMSMRYTGEVEILDRDPDAHRAVMRAKAKEARGQGTADSDIEMVLSESGGATTATIRTQVKLSGKAAAMGAGVITDVAGRLVTLFAGNLQELLAANGEAPEPEPVPGPQATMSAAPTASTPPPYTPPRTAAPTADASLPVGQIVAAVVSGRLRDPRVRIALAGLGVLLLALIVRRRR